MQGTIIAVSDKVCSGSQNSGGRVIHWAWNKVGTEQVLLSQGIRQGLLINET